MIGIALLGVIWAGLRAFGLPRFREHPILILGEKIQLQEPEGLGANPPEIPQGVIWHFEEGTYRVQFVKPLTIDGQTTKGATITARHAGFPISRAIRRRFAKRAVCGKLDTGEQFIAMIRRV